jgi:hypothetical protein
MRFSTGAVLVAVIAGGFGVLGACTEGTGPGGPVLPDSAIPFVIRPSLITYEYTDSSGGNPYRLRWLNDSLFVGSNCLGFIPDPAPGDTAGRFYFATSGPNYGNLERLEGGAIDTTLGYFLPAGIGSQGRYVIYDGNRLRLTWADGGTPSRYFDPSADLRFVGDTLWSSVDLRFNADSGRVVWRVAWLQRACE